MGGGFSSLFPCCKPVTNANRTQAGPQDQELIFADSEPLDETLGHSFCYVRSSNRFVSPASSDHFVTPSSSLRFSPSRSETGFKAISGASVSANSYTPTTVLQQDVACEDVPESAGYPLGVVSVNGFESTESFCALPLQLVPRGGDGFFLSGPIERGALSGPLDALQGGIDNCGELHFSAPLGGGYVRNKRKKTIQGFRKAIRRSFSEKNETWVVPIRNFVSRRQNSSVGVERDNKDEKSVQWALGKAGEDRVHVVVSEDHGWLFVGIYDGFNGPDAPEFLMGNLYRAVYNELKGLFWDIEGEPENRDNAAPRRAEIEEDTTDSPVEHGNGETSLVLSNEEISDCDGNEIASHTTFSASKNMRKRVKFQSEGTGIGQRRQLWELLSENDPEDGLDLSGSTRFAFSVDDAISVGKRGNAVSRRWLLLSKLKQGLSKHREKKLFQWRFGIEEKDKAEIIENDRMGERVSKRTRKVGPVDHDLVLRALSKALEVTELAYLDMTDKVFNVNPELALMGSCLLVVLMRDEDVYVMNLGDSRAIVAHYEQGNVASGACHVNLIEVDMPSSPGPPLNLTALQLSTDHSTSIEEEITRIKNEHPDDNQCIVNDRVKGRLKVTRAFGAGFLKQPKWNNSLLEMFRNEYIGNAPYISCQPSLHHHHLCPQDQFLVLSSDGLYQYLTNLEVVSLVETFIARFPDGDPAQHLIEELLSRAAKKAGMDVHELLDIPQGDRRKYHDDVTVMVISLGGRIWKSSGKYP